MKSFFDFIGRTEIEMYSRLSRNAETGDSDKRWRPDSEVAL
ncbi:hypothetical protein [Mesobacillus sp.]